MGFGAEDVSAVEPLLLTHNERGEIEGVKYDRITVALVNAVREQQAQITRQQAQIEGQNQRVKQQQGQIKAQQREIETLKKQQQEFEALKKAGVRRSPQRLYLQI